MIIVEIVRFRRPGPGGGVEPVLSVLPHHHQSTVALTTLLALQDAHEGRAMRNYHYRYVLTFPHKLRKNNGLERVAPGLEWSKHDSFWKLENHRGVTS
jgi:hypothetical protein